MRWALLGVLGALFVAAPAHAATFNVNTTADGGTTCGSTCTLKGAWLSALNNGSGEEDVISVPAGTYTVAGGLDTTSGQFQTGITIAGAGANSTIIQQSTTIGGGTTRVLNIGAGTFAVQKVTLRNGNATAGGIVQVQSGATLTLTSVRVTGGQATNGGGIAVQGGGSAGHLNLAQSLVDANTATGINGTGGLGGGIALPSNTTGGAATITDSTITANHAVNGAGISSDTNGSVSLAGVTVARNVASGTGAAGGIRVTASSPSIQGSIFDGNTGMAAAGLPVVQANNCSFSTAATDQGGNIDSGNNCGWTVSTQVNTNSQLSSALDQTQQPWVLSIPAGSPAVDASDCAGRLFDQRGVARPQGLRCDAGAFEYQAPVVVTPTPTPTAVPTVAPTATPTPVPTPVFHKDVLITKVSGTVKVKLPGSKNYVDIDTSKGVPLGSSVDTRDGKIELTSVPKAGGTPETATFYDGLFKVTQVGKVTNLALTETLASCKGAHAAAKKPKTRRLWGSGKGNFRTSGKYSAATIRGTTWLVQDSCAGTLTKVKQGVVSVRDNVKHKTIIVKAPHQYLARPKK